jgi:hypothetical protein
MPCLTLPQWVIEEIDRTRRSFFKANGSYCLVAWEYVCRSTSEGGMGSKNLEIQNVYLLAKFIHSILTKPDSLWARWVRAAHLRGKDFGDDLSIQPRAWLHISGLIDTYRIVTSVQISNGEGTSRWKDKQVTARRAISSCTILTGDEAEHYGRRLLPG